MSEKRLFCTICDGSMLIIYYNILHYTVTYMLYDKNRS